MFEVATMTFEAHKLQIILLILKNPDIVNRYLAIVGKTISEARKKYHSATRCDILTGGTRR